MSRAAGWDRLLGLALRRDRVLLPVWVVALALVTVGAVSATADLYPAATDRAELAAQTNTSAALVALYSPIPETASLGAVATFKLLLLGGAFVAALAVILVRRHTRTEEESGRAEMLGAAGAGRHALLVAAVAEATLAAVLCGGLAAGAGIAAGLPPGGSLAFGATWTGLGVVATGLTALGAQVSASSRTVGALVATVLAASYALRAVADAGPDGWGWLSWASPFGWAERTAPYADTRPAVLALPVLVALVTVVAAFVLAERRDLGQGLLAARPGPARGKVRSVAGLTLRTQRGTVVGWLLVAILLGGLVGVLAPAAADLAGSGATRDLLRRVGGAGAFTDTFLAAEVSFVAIAITALAVLVVARLGAEEESGRTSQVLAAGVSRAAVLGASTVLAVLATTATSLLFGVTASIASGRDVVGAALAQLPAVWSVGGGAVLLLGVRRSWAPLGWALLGLLLVLGQVGQLLGIPGWLLEVSPYPHVPAMPSEPFAVGPEVTLLLVAAGLTALGSWRYLRREIG